MKNQADIKRNTSKTNIYMKVDKIMVFLLWQSWATIEGVGEKRWVILKTLSKEKFVAMSRSFR